jgi:hypothetical protein
MRINFEKQSQSIMIVCDELNLYIYTTNGCFVFNEFCIKTINNSRIVLENDKVRFVIWIDYNNNISYCEHTIYGHYYNLDIKTLVFSKLKLLMLNWVKEDSQSCKYSYRII